LAAYEPVRKNGFLLYDDDDYVTDNEHVNQGISLKSLKWAFSESHAANWHPLTWVSHILDCELFGLNPAAHHLVNVLFHTLSTVLLFYVLYRMTGAVWPSWLVAAVFALHPVHVESVAWVAERKDVLSALFWMLTLLAYVRYSERPSVARYLVVFVCLCLGLLAKPMLVTLPFALLLLDYWPLQRFAPAPEQTEQSQQQQPGRTPARRMAIGKLIIEKIPFFAAAAISSVITFLVQRGAGAMKFGMYLPIDVRLGSGIRSYVAYIGKMFYPVKLAIPYLHNEATKLDFNIALLIVIAVSIVVFRLGRRHKYLAVGWLWYIGTLIPVIGIVQVGVQAMADRYTYIPSIGILIIVAWALDESLQRLQAKKLIPTILAVGLFAVLILCTRKQVGYWQNNRTLFGHTIEVAPNNYVAHDIYGQTFLADGPLEVAILHFKRALEIEPRFMAPVGHLARAYAEQGTDDLAVPLLAKALAYGGLANTLAAQQKLGDAVKYLAENILTKPLRADAARDFAWFLATYDNPSYRNPALAIRLAELACQSTNYDDIQSLDCLAAAYASAGRFAEAQEIAARAVEMAESARRGRLAEQIRGRLALYQAHQPYLER